MKLKVGLSGLRQFLGTESPFKMMKNAFCFTLKAFFFYDVTTWLTSDIYVFVLTVC